AHEAPGQTLDATALVHEAYLRLVGADPGKPWEGRGHFFAAAAEAMRRILIDRARRRDRPKHGGGRRRVPLDAAVAADDAPADLTALESLFFAALAKSDPAERADYLAAACAGDAELRGRVERLLRAHPDVGGFLEPPAGDPRSVGTPPPAGAAAGARVGPYR